MVDRLARVSRNEVSAELTSLTADQNPYIIDAMVMAALGAEAASRRAVRGLEVVRIGVGEAPQARFDGRTLDISVATHMGYGGRPSSDYIRRTIELGAVKLAFSHRVGGPSGPGRQSSGAISNPAKSNPGATTQLTSVQAPTDSAVCQWPASTISWGRSPERRLGPRR